MSILDDRRRICAMALVVGAVMFFTFWMGPALQVDVNVAPWPVALMFHGVQIMTLAFGLALVPNRVRLDGLARAACMIGVGAAIVGVALGLGVFAFGLCLLGFCLARLDGFRLGSYSLMAGGVAWLFLFLGGAVIGNEGAPPLDGPERVVAVVGLTLVTAGLISVGWAISVAPKARGLVDRGAVAEDDAILGPAGQGGPA